jgi:xylulose-5-phosphate/fructose-6-phosphate phosphoketolase
MAPVTTDAKPKTADGGKAVAGPLSAEELRKMDAYFRALNYLTVGQIYLLANCRNWAPAPPISIRRSRRS